MKENELVSVIIPNYNKEQYIEQCINSVLAQTYSNIEIIIVDDLSTDRSRKIIQQYESKYENVRAILLNENGGVSRARNIGIKAASADYVTMLDSDDFYYSNEKIANEMEVLRVNSPDGIAYSYRQVVDENSNLLYKERRHWDRYRSGKVYKYLLTEKDGFSFVQRDYIVKKEYILEVGAYTEGDSYYEDYDLLMRLVEKHPMFFTGKDGTAYRLVRTGLSTVQKKNDARQFIVPQKIRLKHIKKMKGKEFVENYFLWLIECMRLAIRIVGRKIKRILQR